MAAEKMTVDSKPMGVHRMDHEDSGAASSPSPERDQNPIAPVELQQPKRKGGRKPIYATSEERKQRNRQAQAAFRERRTEYIKQLEETIRVHESNLHSLQTAHRTAADECLMLRYKNSLLERILLEKGIDVHAELQAKTGSPTLGPAHIPQNIVHPPPIQRAIVSRPARKSISHIAPKIEPGMGGMQPGKMELAAKALPTPTTASGSPPNGHGFSPNSSDGMSMRGSISIPRQSMQTSMHHERLSSVSSTNFYPTPGFQNHLDHLDEEYDVHGDMVDDSELDNPASHFHGSFPGESAQPMMISPTTTGPSHHGGQQFQNMNSLLEQNLDWDPFGLTASMAFPPSQFAFDQGHLR